jgi:adenylate kinase family enzyme
MAVKLFVIGLPGSGKSTVARYISMRAGDRQRSTTHMNDFTILYEMFEQDTHGQFKPADAEYGGFDVLDLTVFDTALRKLEQKVKAYISTTELKEIVLIEFSRNDYEEAFQQFSREFLQDAYFLYLNVDLEICKRRIRERIAQPTTPDDHFVSEYIFDTYYNGDNGNHLSQILERNYGIDKLRVMIVDNGGSQKSSAILINRFVDTIFSFESHCLDQIQPTSDDTIALQEPIVADSTNWQPLAIRSASGVN